jgi:hypothetical protein
LTFHWKEGWINRLFTIPLGILFEKERNLFWIGLLSYVKTAQPMKQLPTNFLITKKKLSSNSVLFFFFVVEKGGQPGIIST